VSNRSWVIFGPEEVFIDEDLHNASSDFISDDEWVGTEKEWYDFIDQYNLTVETSDEDYAIINNRAVFIGAYDEYGYTSGRGQFDDDGY